MVTFAFRSILFLAFTCAVSVLAAAPASNADRKIVLIGGLPSHGPGAHEHNAGVLLLQKCLAGVPGLKTEIVLNGWPRDQSVFEGADAVIIYCDGGEGHPVLQGGNLPALDAVLAKGAGLALLHYAVEPTRERGQAEFMKWIGGAFEIHWSVNPVWVADFKSLPRHPITRGVEPFQLRDEWYFNMRFVDGMNGVTPILAAVPDKRTIVRRDGPHQNNPQVRAAVGRGDEQTVAWAYERSGDVGRGFGFTGGHFHQNWGNDDFRKIALNAILWLARMEVPEQGVVSTVTDADLAANLDLVDQETGTKIPPVESARGSRGPG
ncbi:MAG: ThuA domain-containing protein [Opitutus sp.]